MEKLFHATQSTDWHGFYLYLSIVAALDKTFFSPSMVHGQTRRLLLLNVISIK